MGTVAVVRLRRNASMSYGHGGAQARWWSSGELLQIGASSSLPVGASDGSCGAIVPCRYEEKE